MYNFIYAINVSILNNNTVYTRVWHRDRTNVKIDHGY